MIVFFVVLACTCLLTPGMVSLTLPGNSTCCLSSDHCACDAWSMCHDSLFSPIYCCLHLLLLFVHLVVRSSTTSGWCACSVGGRAWSLCPHAWGTLLVVVLVCCRDCCHCGACAAHVNHDDDNDSRHRVKRTTRGSCTGWQNIAVCIHPARIAVIEVPAAIVIVTVGVLLWYSQRPHGALVTFLGKAVLRLWGWLQRPSLLH